MLLWAELASWFFDEVGLVPPGLLPKQGDGEIDPEYLGTYDSRDATFTIATNDAGEVEVGVATFGNETPTIVPAVVVRPNVYRTNRPIVDPYGVVSTEVTVDGSRLLHAGPFTARHRPSD